MNGALSSGELRGMCYRGWECSERFVGCVCPWQRVLHCGYRGASILMLCYKKRVGWFVGSWWICHAWGLQMFWATCWVGVSAIQFDWCFKLNNTLSKMWMGSTAEMQLACILMLGAHTVDSFVFAQQKWKPSKICFARYVCNVGISLDSTLYGWRRFITQVIVEALRPVPPIRATWV